WALSPDGLTLTGTANGNQALTVVIAPSGVNTYTYTVTLLQPLDHPLHDDPSTGGTEISFEDELAFNITVQVKDSQGATDTAILSVQVEDDSPTAMTPEVTAVVEDEQFNPSTDEPAGLAGDPNPDLGASVSGDVSNT